MMVNFCACPHIIINKEVIQISADLTIVYPPTANWYLLRQRPQQLLTAFSRHPGVRSVFITQERFKKLPRPVMKLSESLFVIRKDVDYRRLVSGKKVLWLSYAPQISYAEHDDFDLVAFDVIDNPVDEFAHWENGLQTAIDKADLIFCTAHEMYNRFAGCSKPVLLCPNGADFEHFYTASSAITRPPDFPNVKKPVVGFYGAMASWLDTALLEKIAEKFPVILIGNNRFMNLSFSSKNIYTLDHKDYEQLPAYLANFDVALIPFKLTEMTKGCDPIKCYEYLSAGKPVVSTHLEELNKFKELIHFIDMNNCHDIINRAVKENNEEKRLARIAAAKEHSWDNRATMALEAIQKIL
jgi:glycosyltransferase involved in cell wall biosynthesis